MTAAAAVVSVSIVAAFIVVGVEDATTSRVTIRRAQLITALSVLGLGAAAIAGDAWDRLVGAALGALAVTTTLAFPYWLQSRRIDQGQDPGLPNQAPTEPMAMARARADLVGKADLRLAVPFGWTLGWFDIGLAVAGFTFALVTGVLVAAGGRRPSVPFVPFLAIGLAAGVAWGLWDLVR